ncbi:MAG: hypothetical protein C4523_12005 [Myxococcales bacterium]|nr:MAG: hypothetical protein C4523_12005 [Myxococcales bacterium]
MQANAYALWDFDGLAVELDFPFWLHEIVTDEALDFTWYAGPGALFAFWNSGHIGRFGGTARFAGIVKAALGLALQFHGAPMDLVFQFSPGVQVHEAGAGVWLGALIATRYYF